MMNLCAFIVAKRNLFFLLFALAIAFSAVSRGWVGVENSISAFLPDTTETRQGLSVMEREFTTFGTAKVMAANLPMRRRRRWPSAWRRSRAYPP